MASAPVAPGLTAFIALRIAQAIRLRVQKRVQCLLHRAPYQPVQVVLDPLVVDRDDIAQRTRCILCHGGSFLLSWLCLATSSSARFGAASPTQLCETFCTSSDCGRCKLMCSPESTSYRRSVLRSAKERSPLHSSTNCARCSRAGTSKGSLVIKADSQMRGLLTAMLQEDI